MYAQTRRGRPDTRAHTQFKVGARPSYQTCLRWSQRWSGSTGHWVECQEAEWSHGAFRPLCTWLSELPELPDYSISCHTSNSTDTLDSRLLLLLEGFLWRCLMAILCGVPRCSTNKQSLFMRLHWEYHFQGSSDATRLHTSPSSLAVGKLISTPPLHTRIRLFYGPHQVHRS